MSLIAFGINHNTASVEIREKVAFSPDTLSDALKSSQDSGQIKETVILSTCNRTEVYAVAEELEGVDMVQWLAQFHAINTDELSDKFYIYRDEVAVRHLMEVACGLDSLILGEPQILGQLKQAFSNARNVGVVGSKLNKLFESVFATAKRVRTETEIGANAVSVAFAAVQLAKHIFSDVADSRILLIGAGETIELVATHLKEQGVNQILVANRTVARGEQLAQKFNAKVITLSQLQTALHEADIVISSTASQLPLVGKGLVESALKMRKNKPMLFVDLAVPRDIEPQVKEVNGAYLYTIDDLQHIVQENLASREQAARDAKEIVSEQVSAFSSWQQVQKHVDLVKQFRQQSESEKERLLVKAKNQLVEGADPDKVLQEFANKLTNSFLHGPTSALKNAAEQQDEKMLLKLANIYDLDINAEK